MLGIIVAMNEDRVIGINDSIPWFYKGDQARFKRITCAPSPSAKCLACGRSVDDWLGAGGMLGCRVALGGPHEWSARSVVIMGRKTWESIPRKYRPLTGRFNIVITSLRSDDPRLEGVDGTSDDFEGALRISALSGDVEVRDGGVIRSKTDVWVIGGGQVYVDAIKVADFIDVTWVPWTTTEEKAWEKTESEGRYQVVSFPPIDEKVFAPGPIETHPDNSELRIQRFERRYGLKDNEKLREAGLMSRGKLVARKLPNE